LDDPAEVERLRPILRTSTRPWGTLPLVRRIVLREAQKRPRVLVLDDAQHSLDVVRFARALWSERAQVPLLVVVAVEEESLAREPEVRDQVDALGDSDGVRTVRLGPLTASEQEELLQSLVSLDPESRSSVLERASGHPGYVVALVTTWAGKGALAPSPRGFRLVSEPEPPAGSWSSVWARWMADWIGTLPIADQILLERAAVIGRAVDVGLWERVSDDPDARVPLDRVVLDIRAARRRAALIDRLVTSGLAYDTDQGFTFTHPSLVDVLLEQARLAGRLERHHRSCANHLRRMPQPEHALALGHHLAEGQVWEEASRALLAGINWHWRQRDRRPLLTQLDRAERCADNAGWLPDDPRRADLLRARSQLMTSAGRPDEGAQLARRAVDLAFRLGDRDQIARALVRLVDTLVVASRWEEAMVQIPTMLEYEDALPDPAVAGIGRVRMGRACLARGDARGAEAWFADGERHLVAIEPSVMSMSALLELYDFTGQPERSLEVAQRLEPFAYEEGRADVRLFAMSKRVEALLALKRFAAGIELARECLLLNDQLGDKRFSAYMRVELGVLELRDGRLADARATLTDVLADVDRGESTWLAMVALLARAEASLVLGDLDAWDKDFDEIVQLVSTGRFERDSLCARLERMQRQVAERGHAWRAEALETLAKRIAVPEAMTLAPDATVRS
jgi:tetratricopeptide (TPR) repeat protein